MVADKGPYEQAYDEDLNKLSMANRFIACNDATGKAKGKFDCANMDISSYIYNAELGCNSQELIGFTYINDLWGWTDPQTGEEYALVGMFDGTSVVDITDPSDPVGLGFIETSGDLSPDDTSGFWRDMKVANNVAYIGSEIAHHGVQVFDLSRLSTLERPNAFKGKGNGGDKGENVGQIPTGKQVTRLEPDLVITSAGTSHNIVQFPEVNKVLVVGLSEDSEACDVTKGESVAVFDVSDPLDPILETCLSGDYNVCTPDKDCSYDGYVHDGQCIIYDGPDDDYKGVPICVFFVETEVVIFNMDTDAVINKFTWPDAAYGKTLILWLIVTERFSHHLSLRSSPRLVQ